MAHPAPMPTMITVLQQCSDTVKAASLSKSERTEIFPAWSLPVHAYNSLNLQVGCSENESNKTDLNQNRAKRPDVTLHRVSAMEEQRRARPCRSSDLGEGVRCHAVQHFPQAKVRNLASPLSGQEDIWALHVQMSD